MSAKTSKKTARETTTAGPKAAPNTNSEQRLTRVAYLSKDWKESWDASGIAELARRFSRMEAVPNTGGDEDVLVFSNEPLDVQALWDSGLVWVWGDIVAFGGQDGLVAKLGVLENQDEVAEQLEAEALGHTGEVQA